MSVCECTCVYIDTFSFEICIYISMKRIIILFIFFLSLEKVGNLRKFGNYFFLGIIDYNLVITIYFRNGKKRERKFYLLDINLFYVRFF